MVLSVVDSREAIKWKTPREQILESMALVPLLPGPREKMKAA